MEKTDRIFLAGHQGLVGSAIRRELERKGYNNLLLKTRAELDLMDRAAVERFFAEERPDYVFLAAAKVGGIFANNPDLQFATRSLRCGDDFAVCEWTASARGVEWDGVDVFPIEDGLIRRKDVYSASHRPRGQRG